MHRKIAIVLTVMAAGRAMTIPFISRAGDGGPGDPPEAWLMPLLADAAIGVTAIIVAILVWRRPNPTSWAIAIAWSAIGCFDAMAAFIIQVTDPWPEFFMLELFGRSMFFAAAALHAAIIYFLATPQSRAEFNIAARRAAVSGSAA